MILFAARNMDQNIAVLVIFPYLQQPPTNAHAEYSSDDRGQNFDQSPNNVYASSEGSGDSAHLQKLA